jgi:ABC-type Zn uptake system ZnuABC Zn-binding protein ZnuA
VRDEKTRALLPILTIAIWVMVTLGGCGSTTPERSQERAEGLAGLLPADLADGETLKVVATTNILGDVVRQVGGDYIELAVLMGIGVDPHSYVPAPTDTAAVHDAHLVFANGVGLEADLEEMLASAGGSAAYIQASQGLDLLPASPEEDTAPTDQEHDHGAADPHVWFSVPSVIHWVDNIEAALSARDPGNASSYQGNARNYRQALEVLDDWIQEQVAQVPQANRKLVTNHLVFGYFARQYGFEQLGAVYPFNPSSEPSARDIARLEDAIRQYDVPAIFAENTVNPRLAQQVAEDTGIEIVPLYTGSLGEPGSGAETYLEMMRHDVRAIVEALKGE